MATKVFAGASNDWSNVNNWGGAIPVNGDDVVVPDTTSQAITVNLDRTGDGGGTGLHLNSLYVARGYLGYIGASGNPLKCTVQNANFWQSSITHRGAGEFWFNSETGTAGHVSGTVVVTADNDSASMTIAGDRNIGRLVILKGHVTISAAFSGTLALVDMSYVSSKANDAKLTLSSTAGAAVGLIEMQGGVAVASRQVGQVVLADGCTYTQENYGLGQLFQGGGVCVFNTDSSVDSLGVASVRAGTLDCTRNSNTKLIDNLYKWRGATVLKTERTTITNEHAFDDEEV